MEKRKYFRRVDPFIHFFMCASVLCFGQLGQQWTALGISTPINGWVALAALSFFHFLEDEWRVRTIRKDQSADSFKYFLLDQCIHIALIYIFFPPRTGLFSEKWIALAILFVLTTHFTSIFVYFSEKALSGSSKLDAKERYYSMAERLGVSLALLLPGFWAFCFIAVWFPGMFIRHSHKEYEVSLMNVLIGNVLAVLFGLVGRAIYYG